MIKFRIRQELIERVSAINSKYRETPTSEEGLTGMIETLEQRASATKLFTAEIIEILYQILEEQNIQISAEEETALANDLKPTILDLIQQHFN